jgi:hypothetical protein
MGSAWIVLFTSLFLAPGAPTQFEKCSARPAAALANLPEASGVALSGRVPGRLWAHNDSGQPILFALDRDGHMTGHVELRGITLDDWETVAVASCAEGSCLYVGDIGDNRMRRKDIAVYRFLEPDAGDRAVSVKETLRATYPDGAHDAEALFVMPNGRIFVVTKGEGGAVALYQFPRQPRDGIYQLERVAVLDAKPRPADRITDAAASKDGEWIALRSTRQLMIYRSADLLSGNIRDAARIDLAAAREPQGEGVTFGDGKSLYLVGEGGGESRAGTFARVTCE